MAAQMAVLHSVFVDHFRVVAWRLPAARTFGPFGLGLDAFAQPLLRVAVALPSLNPAVPETYYLLVLPLQPLGASVQMVLTESTVY